MWILCKIRLFQVLETWYLRSSTFVPARSYEDSYRLKEICENRYVWCLILNILSSIRRNDGSFWYFVCYSLFWLDYEVGDRIHLSWNERNSPILLNISTLSSVKKYVLTPPFSSLINTNLLEDSNYLNHLNSS